MSMEQRIIAAGVQRRLPIYARCGLAAAFALLAYELALFLISADQAIRFPFELDYGEGIVWEQMRLMLAGAGYGSIDGLPAIVFHYPPLFHIISAAFSAAFGMDQLAAGRSVSALATLIMALFAGLIAYRAVRPNTPPKAAAICGLISGLVTLSFWPVTHWATLMRVDMVAAALSLAGIFAAMLSLERPRLILVAAFCFVAATYTKQTAVVAPAAVFLTFLLLRPRLAWTCAAACAALGLAILGALAWITDGGFVRHIFLYNINRFDASRLIFIPTMVGIHAVYFGIAGIGIAAWLRRQFRSHRAPPSLAALRTRLSQRPADAFFLLVLIYVLLSTLMTMTVAKSGSNINYFIDWMAAVAVLVGISTRRCAMAAVGSGDRHGAATNSLFGTAALPALLAIQALLLPPPPDFARQTDSTRLAEMQELVRLVRAADRPVISDDMVLLVRSGVPVQWEPAIFAELANTGVWDERPFVGRIKSGHFAFFITVGNRGERLFDSRYTPAVAAAIRSAYPRQRQMAGYILHMPRT